MDLRIFLRSLSSREEAFGRESPVPLQTNSFLPVLKTYSQSKREIRKGKKKKKHRMICPAIQSLFVFKLTSYGGRNEADGIMTE